MRPFCVVNNFLIPQSDTIFGSVCFLPFASALENWQSQFMTKLKIKIEFLSDSHMVLLM